MGKRRGGRELLRGLSKKQRKHLREFGEEHPFHDKVPGRPEATQVCELSDSSDKSSAESDSETEVEQVSVYHKLLATLKTSPESESEEEEEEDESEPEAEESETEMDSEGSQESREADGGGEDQNDVPEQEEATDTAEQTPSQQQADGIDTSCDPGHGVVEEFTDVKHESEFSLETNFMEEESGDCNADKRDGSSSQAFSEDPFKQHMDKELEEKDVEKMSTLPKTSSQSQWPRLGQVTFSSTLEKPKALKADKEVDVKQLYLHKPLESTWPKVNKQFLSSVNKPSDAFFTPLQRELFCIMNTYRDLFYPERNALTNGEEIRHAYCLHALNHVLKANSQVLSNNAKKRNQKPGADNDDHRDQGLTRPKHLMKHVNLLPLDSHGVDFSRVRMLNLNNWCRYYRQTLLFSALQDPQVNSVFNKHCFNYTGQVAVRNVPLSGSISRVVVQLPHVFRRLEAESLTSVIDTRFQFFIDKVLPEYRDAIMSHTLIYVPSYFDYVRLRNYFKKEELNFTHICEYTKKAGVCRARRFFLKGEKQFLLFTERFHFYKRYTIKGIRNLIFYELPTYSHFYSEICNMMKATGNGGDATWTCTVLYSKYDAQKLAAVVGIERAAQMLQSKKNVHLFVTGESE
ncbi:U3 small nucleolar RNA-associated protein 25 homolog isoform X2 [Pezoporus flaviventris]|uniref:U3 small nucleolar RNA-associated protein 25 homolog isoform X2 n=1 Tax=Pezoporus flaviventris TaxID=889875 RepID=UPI002AB159DC|nr:U3 small nucleolar RNA-associated protein 25 homolog isoform X2 [Pezoporus flaviventris]